MGPSTSPHNYDIFISYRQKDNKGEQWVTQFVKSLKEELEATFKEDISVYFDQNPRDGLNENHDVDDSLKEKVNSLVFIPILSQTYCDTRSFAWKSELLPFLEFAKGEDLGLKITLGNGNVSSRILPIRIHELDPEDVALFEKTTGGALRSLDFIYEEKGVNRPLRPVDDRKLNLRGTGYRNQINKVAQAIKEIKRAAEPHKATTGYQQPEQADKPAKRSLFKWMALAAVLILLGAMFIYGPLTNKASTEKKPIEKSIAVLPFQDFSPQKDQEWFSDGLTEELLNSLANVPELLVTARTSSFAFKDKDLPVKVIADSLGVNYILEGSVRKSGENLRITAQLINPVNGKHLWSEIYDRKFEDVFAIQEDIATNIVKSLDILLDEEKRNRMFSIGTRNPAAYEAYLLGNVHFDRAHSPAAGDEALVEANRYYERAMKLDPSFGAPYYRHSDYYAHLLVFVPDELWPDSLNRDDAVRQVQSDLMNAKRLAKNRAEEIFYELELAALNNDWTPVPRLFNELDQNPEYLGTISHFGGGWARGLFVVLERSDLGLKVTRHQMANDPLSSQADISMAMYLGAADQVDSALYWLDRDKSSGRARVAILELILRPDSFDRYDNLASAGVFAQAFGRIINGQAFPDTLQEQLSGPNPSLKFYASYLFYASGDQQKADSMALLVDNRHMGSFLIMDRLIGFAGKLPFNLTAAPNFSKRLREAGVEDLESYQKRNRLKLPSENQ